MFERLTAYLAVLGIYDGGVFPQHVIVIELLSPATHGCQTSPQIWDFFLDQFQYILAQKVPDLTFFVNLKSPIFFPFGANLTQFGTKSGIRGHHSVFSFPPKLLL